MRLGPIEEFLNPKDNTAVTTLVAKHYASTVEALTKKLFLKKLDAEKVSAGKGEIVKMVTEQPMEKRMESFIRQVTKGGKGKGKGPGTVATDRSGRRFVIDYSKVIQQTGTTLDPAVQATNIAECIAEMPKNKKSPGGAQYPKGGGKSKDKGKDGKKGKDKGKEKGKEKGKGKGKGNNPQGRGRGRGRGRPRGRGRGRNGKQ